MDIVSEPRSAQKPYEVDRWSELPVAIRESRRRRSCHRRVVAFIAHRGTLEGRAAIAEHFDSERAACVMRRSWPPWVVAYRVLNSTDYWHIRLLENAAEVESVFFQFDHRYTILTRGPVRGQVAYVVRAQNMWAARERRSQDIQAVTNNR